MVADTSLEAYRQILADGTISLQEFDVVSVIHTPMTSRQIAQASRIERSSVVARLNSLVKKDIVDDSQTTECSYTGKTVKQYRRTNER